MKDQLDAYLPQLLEIQTGLERCGIHDSIRKYPEMWEVVFESGSFLREDSQLQLRAGLRKRLQDRQKKSKWYEAPDCFI